MKKKLLTILLSVFLVISSFTINVLAEEDTFIADGIWYKVLKDIDYVEVSDGNMHYKEGSTGITVTIPSSVINPNTGKKYIVKNIGNNAFKDSASIQSVIIPDNIVNIGDNAFISCNNLTSIKLPLTLETIGKQAFASCSNLANITIPKNVTLIGEAIFYGCPNLKTIICNAVEPPTLENSIFNDSFNDVRIMVPRNSIDKYINSDPHTSKGWYAYKDNIAKIPTIIDIIPEDFPTSANIGWANKTNDNAVVYINSARTGLFFEDMTNSIKQTGLFTTATIEESGDNYKFENVDTEVTFIMSQGKLVSIEYDNKKGGSFYDGTYAKLGTQAYPWKIGATGNEENVRAYIKDGNTLCIEGSGDMQDFVFSPWCLDNTITAIDIGSGITNIGECCFESLASITEVEVPYGVTKIGKQAFNACTSLSKVILPETVTEIGKQAFCSVQDSANIYIEATTPPTLDDEIVYWGDSKKYYVYVPSSSINEYKNNTSWKNHYLNHSGNNFIKPIVFNIDDVLGFADGSFPSSSESAPSNAWISINGAKVYKTASTIKFEKGSSNLTFDLNSTIVEGDEKYTYSNDEGSLEFNVVDYSLISIILTNTSSDLDGTYYDSTSIAAALAKANGAFPTSSTNGWFNDNDIYIYESNNNLCLYSDKGKGMDIPLCKINEKLDNENKYIIQEIAIIKFNIVDNKLLSITISGMPNPYNVANGTYAAPITIADILPIDFPTKATLGWLKVGDSNNNRAYIDKNDSKLIVGSANAPLNTVLSKDNDNYKCTVSGPSFTFNMDSNILKSITLNTMSSASGDYIPYEYVIEPTDSKPQGYAGDLVFKTNGQYTNESDVVVKVDGTPLILNTDYTIEHGSIKVTLLGSYIKNLAPKTYTISIGVPGSYDEITSQFTITAAPSPDPTPRYKIPNTGVEGTYSNNHSLLKLSFLSLLAIGTCIVIKKKKDN